MKPFRHCDPVEDVCASIKFLRSSRETLVALCPDFFVFFLFQDLQFEIDTERENFLSLTATGRKILKQMDDGSSGGMYISYLKPNHTQK